MLLMLLWRAAMPSRESVWFTEEGVWRRGWWRREYTCVKGAASMAESERDGAQLSAKRKVAVNMMKSYNMLASQPLATRKYWENMVQRRDSRDISILWYCLERSSLAVMRGWSADRP